MIHDPKSVHVIGRGDIKVIKPADRGCGSSIPPFMDFCMAVHERKASRAAVIAGGKIHQHPLLRLIGPAAHARTPLAIIHAIATLIEENDGFRGSGSQNLAHLFVLGKSGAETVCIAAVKPTKHRDAPLPRKRLPGVRTTRGNAGVFVVAGTPPDAGTISTVRPE